MRIFFIFLFFPMTNPSNFEKILCSWKLNWSGLNMAYCMQTTVSLWAAWSFMYPQMWVSWLKFWSRLMLFFFRKLSFHQIKIIIKNMSRNNYCTLRNCFCVCTCTLYWWWYHCLHFDSLESKHQSSLLFLRTVWIIFKSTETTFQETLAVV